MDEEKQGKNKDYSVSRSLKMLFRGFIDMLRMSMVLSVVTVFLLAAALVVLLVTNYDGALRILRFLGLNV